MTSNFTSDKKNAAALKMIQGADPGRDQNIDPAVEKTVLIFKRDTTDQERFREVLMFAVNVELFSNLRSEFPRGLQDEGERGIRARVRVLAREYQSSAR